MDQSDLAIQTPNIVDVNDSESGFEKLYSLLAIATYVWMQSCPQVRNFEDHIWLPSAFYGGHLKFLRAIY